MISSDNPGDDYSATEGLCLGRGPNLDFVESVFLMECLKEIAVLSVATGRVYVSLTACPAIVIIRQLQIFSFSSQLLSWLVTNHNAQIPCLDLSVQLLFYLCEWHGKSSSWLQA